MRMKRSSEEWARLVHEQRTSQKSVAEFCKERGIHPNLFYRKVKAAKETGTFVKVAAPMVNTGLLEITAGSIRISLGRPFSDADLIQIMRCLKEAANA